MSFNMSLVRAQPADKSRLINFLFDNFVTSEPVMVATGHDEHTDAYIRGIPQDHTLLAVDDDGSLLGAAFNGEVTAAQYNVMANTIANMTCEKCLAYYKFWLQAGHAAVFWPEGEPTRAMSLEALCVGVGARGRGVGRALVEGSRQLAREAGFSLFTMDCTSHYAARLAQAVGMKCVKSLPYGDYKNEKGEPVYKIKAPHDALKVYTLRL